KNAIERHDPPTSRAVKKRMRSGGICRDHSPNRREFPAGWIDRKAQSARFSGVVDLVTKRSGSSFNSFSRNVYGTNRAHRTQVDDDSWSKRATSHTCSG